MSKVLNETRLSMTAAGKMFGVSRETVRQWIKRGVKGHKLEHIRTGQRFVTSREAVLRFCAALDRDYTPGADFGFEAERNLAQMRLDGVYPASKPYQPTGEAGELVS